MPSFDPVTLQWDDDDEDAPAPVALPGSVAPPTFYTGSGGGTDPADALAVPEGQATQDGILQPLAVTQEQESSTKGSTTKNETSGKVETAAVKAAAKEQDDAQADLVEAAKERAKAELAAATKEKAKNELDAAVQEIETAEAKKTLAEKQRIDTAGQNYVNARVAEFNTQAAKQDDKFFEDEDTATKVLWGVGLLLGAFGAIKTGVNSAAMMLSDTVDKWDIDRRTRLETARKAVQDARTWADKRVRDYLDDEIKLAPLKKAAALESLADKVQADLAARQGQLDANAIAKSNEFIAKARADAAKIKADSAKDFAPTATTGGGTSTSDRTGTVVQTPNQGRSNIQQQKRLDDMRADVTARQNVHRRMQEIVDFVKDKKLGPTGLILDPRDRGQLDSLQSALQLELATAKNRGASFTDSEQKMVDGISGDVSKNNILNSVPRAEKAVADWRKESELSFGKWGFDKAGAAKAFDSDAGKLELPAGSQPAAAPARAATPGPGAQVRKLSQAQPKPKGAEPVERKQVGNVWIVKKNGKWDRE